MKPKESQLRKGVIELAVLAQLANHPSYGGELIEKLATKAGLQVSPGTLYPLLTRLRADGALTTSWRESPVGPPRKYYQLTATGNRRLAESAATWQELTTAISILMETEK